uniref:Dilute domain-containing protein n=1 Tax=Guillardia theta TaxID=55529 RepID=A0A6U6DUN9_GUITH|mmetsp:Transcript_7936/g.26588  ORF Transcript_7936/g.26588 Transcript_7936/m.26588 type:complete len:522 (+) Transcript_7936:351-1916(+)
MDSSNSDETRTRKLVHRISDRVESGTSSREREREEEDVDWKGVKSKENVKHRMEKVAAVELLKAIAVIKQHEQVLADLSLKVEFTEIESDLFTLLESCIYCISPYKTCIAGPSENGGSNVRTEPSVVNQYDVCYSAWIITRSMLHWNLYNVPEQESAALPAASSSFVSLFFDKMSRAWQSMAASCDPQSMCCFAILSNISSLLIALRSKTLPGKGKEAGRSKREISAADQLRTEVESFIKSLSKTLESLYARAIEAEFKDMKLAALNLVQLCVGGEAASGVALVESYFRRLAERFEDAGLLPWFRRGIAKAVMAYLDGELLDVLLTESSYCTFDGALALKSGVTRVERVVLKAANKFGWDEQLSNSTLAVGSRSSMQVDVGPETLSLPLTRQATDVLMMEKYMLVGPEATDWRQQICPNLSTRRIFTLVASFSPDPSAPNPVPKEVLSSLKAEASSESSGPLHGKDDLSHRASLEYAPFPRVNERELVLHRLALPLPAVCIPEGMRSKRSFSFLKSDEGVS